MVTVLTIAMVFTGLNVQIARFHSQSRRGLMGETNIPVQEFWLKVGRGLMREGGGGRMDGIL